MFQNSKNKGIDQISIKEGRFRREISEWRKVTWNDKSEILINDVSWVATIYISKAIN